MIDAARAFWASACEFPFRFPPEPPRASEIESAAMVPIESTESHQSVLGLVVLLFQRQTGLRAKQANKAAFTPTRNGFASALIDRAKVPEY